MTILKIEVIIRKFKCHQQIPRIWFAGNDISNYGLILNTYGARDQNKILVKNFKFFLKFAVVKIRNSKKYFSFDVHQPLSFLHSENDVSGISTEKDSGFSPNLKTFRYKL
jgi:hypothetical protein